MQLKRINRLRVQWNILKDKEEKNGITLPERKRVSELDVQLHYFPADDQDALPTQFGNTIRAAETSSYHKYGLDAIVCWPRIWLLLPEQVQRELIDSRQKLEESIEFWVWGFLFLLWVFYSGWAAAISLVWMFIGYSFMNELACSFADLFESTFDLYRWELYKHLRWPLPGTSGETEIMLGKRITEFLWRGTDSHAGTIDYSGSE